MDTSIVFVILHYNVIQETENCVDSIRSHIDTDSWHIVIVDNASPNHSGEKLREMYRDDERITVLENRENLGFAQGNNAGYRYAAKHLKPRFIWILNNDTLLIQDDFFGTIRKEYEASRFGVLGPKVILADGRVQSLYFRFPDLAFFERELKIQSRDLRLRKYHLYVPARLAVMACHVLRWLFGHPARPRMAKYRLYEGLDERREDVVLHGCCLVFSGRYMAEYEEAFHPGTFLYREEDLLYLRCRKKHLPTVYAPALLIRHLEDAATDSVVRKKREKVMFQREHEIRSLKILIEELKKGEG